MTIEIKNIIARPRIHNGELYTPRSFDAKTVYNADVDPGKSIRLHGVKDSHPFDISFKLGGEAVYGSYNLIYTGKIVKITPNTITIEEDDHRIHRLRLYEFSWRNCHFDAKKISDHNYETSFCI